MAAKKAKPADDTIEVRTPNSKTVARVRKDKYDAMKRALDRVLPTRAPGLTQAEMFARVVPHLPDDLFPGGETAGWWVKCVQLDQETRGGIVREESKPLRWHRRK